MITQVINGHYFVEAGGTGDESDFLVCEHCGQRTRFPERTAYCPIGTEPPKLLTAMLEVMNLPKEKL